MITSSSALAKRPCKGFVAKHDSFDGPIVRYIWNDGWAVYEKTPTGSRYRARLAVEGVLNSAILKGGEVLIALDNGEVVTLHTSEDTPPTPKAFYGTIVTHFEVWFEIDSEIGQQLSNNAWSSIRFDTGQEHTVSYSRSYGVKAAARMKCLVDSSL